MPDLRDSEEEGSRIVDVVEERIRGCVLESKRRKCRPSPCFPLDGSPIAWRRSRPSSPWTADDPPWISCSSSMLEGESSI
ncbi:hypothetical protein COCNU_08G007980 [Cocos nucifera]|uniref:Uncharacterized protein n=1 Tax=Cocos nucifera TaxID=13894 RepID=A0A8K0N6X3_COCNU|nr:hypothetical protein COCNU_08G007980 [Cocos nucifera]